MNYSITSKYEYLNHYIIGKQYKEIIIIVGIVKWDHKVSLVGGINAPKKLLCLCSDGIIRPQLLKGKDDLRQDAVMQQVFCMINNLLMQESTAVERKLLIRTYKVIPLSTRSGILEWCQNTIPIGMYITEARKKYRPKEYSVHKCRQLASVSCNIHMFYLFIIFFFCKVL